jgi:hypothetical protein
MRQTQEEFTRQTVLQATYNSLRGWDVVRGAFDWEPTGILFLNDDGTPKFTNKEGKPLYIMTATLMA